jgi:hypothetical protein
MTRFTWPPELELRVTDAPGTYTVSDEFCVRLYVEFRTCCEAGIVVVVTVDDEDVTVVVFAEAWDLLYSAVYDDVWAAISVSHGWFTPAPYMTLAYW